MNPRVMETEGLLQCSQGPVTDLILSQIRQIYSLRPYFFKVHIYVALLGVPEGVIMQNRVLTFSQI